MVERIRRAGQFAWAMLGLAGLVVLVGVVGWYFRVIWPPLIFAGAIAFILNPVVNFFQRRHVPRFAGAAFAYLGVVAGLVLIGLLLAPLVSHQSQQLSEQWPELRSDVERWVNDMSRRSKQNDWIVEVPSIKEIQKSFKNDNTSLADRVTQVRAIGRRVFHVALIVVLAPVIAFYLLVDLPHLGRMAESLVPVRARPEATHVARRLNRAIGGYFRGQLLVALIVGVMVSIGLAIIGLPFWLIIGMIAGVFNMIPLIGPWVGAVPGVVIALTTADFKTALLVVAVMAGAQQIDNHFITPKVMQRAVSLHPTVVILALLAGGTVGGFFGLLLAVPVAATIKIVGGHLWHTYVLGEPFDAIGGDAPDDDAPGGEPDTALTDEPFAELDPVGIELP
jgi:predicted PurR-regulated permease PerM